MTAEQWFLATCLNCEPRLPQPFRDRAEGLKWATAHAAGTGHEVEFVSESGGRRSLRGSMSRGRDGLLQSAAETNRAALNQLED